MKEKPILMTSDLVLATLKGRKTQTRRIVKNWDEYQYVDQLEDNWRFSWDAPGVVGFEYVDCPYGVPGDRLWVRERHKLWTEEFPDEPDEMGDIANINKAEFVRWAATPRIGRRRWVSDGTTDNITYLDKSTPIANAPKFDAPWRPFIHMPRWACRLVLEVVSVRVERIRDIGLDDIEKEGVSCNYCCPLSLHDAAKYREKFKALWNNINGPNSWDANPWVWVVEFKRVEKQ